MAGKDTPPSSTPRGIPPIAHALREALRQGYGWRDARQDAFAGVVVGIVAIPLSMALAIASGAPPQNGLYTATVAGSLIALLGGSRVQVSGPTAAFVVILAPIVGKYGLGGLLLATLLAGVFLLLLGIARMGRLVQFIPFPVVTGFTSGMALVIAILQVKDLLGLDVHLPDRTVTRLSALANALPSLSPSDTVVGLVTLALLILVPRLTRRVPAPLVALALPAAAVALLARLYPNFHVATIASRFGYEHGGAAYRGVPPLPPLPAAPWTLPGPDGAPIGLSLSTLEALLIPAAAIAALGAIESLLSALVADGMAGTRHDPDSELVAQGIGNLVVPFFGGFAATGALARTATNVRYGARSPIAAVVHAAFVLASVLALSPLLGALPMASLAALLLVVAWNMAEVRHITHVVRVAPRSDLAVLAACFTLTVVFDMVIAVTVGVLLAALLFMRRMAEVSGARLVGAGTVVRGVELPPGVVVYQIAGPLFFGAAQKAMGVLAQVGRDAKVVVFDVGDVPAMDATGLANFESAVRRLRARNALPILLRLQDQPRRVIERAFGAGGVHSVATLEEAVNLANAWLETRAPTAAPPPVALDRAAIAS